MHPIIGCIVVVVGGGRDGEPTPQCPDGFCRRVKEKDAEKWYNMRHEETSGNEESGNGAKGERGDLTSPRGNAWDR